MRINADCSHQSLEGKFLRFLYYNTRIFDLFAAGERSGFPNNGAYHSLRLQAALADINAFLELVSERYALVEGCPEFVGYIRGKMK